jgi:ketosteroid isomerase-like protein
VTPKETVLAFVHAINAHDVDSVGKLMTDDHTFVDPYGSEVAGCAQMLAGRRGYFKWFPDYQIDVSEIFERESEFGIFGFAAGSFQGNADRKWRLPAAWRAVVRDGRIARWQVIADTKLPFESMSGSQL